VADYTITLTIIYAVTASATAIVSTLQLVTAHTTTREWSNHYTTLYIYSQQPCIVYNFNRCW